MGQSKALLLLVLAMCAGPSLEQEETTVDCGSRKELTVAWADLPPYIYPKGGDNIDGSSGEEGGEGGEPEGALHTVLESMTRNCCGGSYT
jgi:hypothetical protein